MRLGVKGYESENIVGSRSFLDIQFRDGAAVAASASPPNSKREDWLPKPEGAAKIALSLTMAATAFIRTETARRQSLGQF